MIFRDENGEEHSKNSNVIMLMATEDIWTKKIVCVPRGNVEAYKFESKNLKDKGKVVCAMYDASMDENMGLDEFEYLIADV